MGDPCCRFCDKRLTHTFVDLGMSPLSNAYVKGEDLRKREIFYPLHAYVCERCFLVQLEEFESPEQIFSEYAYFSSYSQSWLEHARVYVEEMSKRFGYDNRHQVVEIASNDGYLLQFFQKKGIPVLGVEPAANVAKVAQENGISTVVSFFGVETAKKLVGEGTRADLLLGNNVLAHVPDINDFVAGMKILLRQRGVITMEFPHLLQLMRQNQFDTIYHEHFSYLSLSTVMRIFAHHGLRVFDAEELSTHGGSLRIYAKHAENDMFQESARLHQLLAAEENGGLGRLETYKEFEGKVHKAKRELLQFLVAAKDAGKSVVAYGAAAKGNTLLNYCGIRGDFIDYVVDRSPHKQGMFLPGTHIPIHDPDKIAETKPDYVLILPWNLKDEIERQMRLIREWGGRFVVPIPTVQVF
ncbi:methyltransferase domain-containing protein [Thiovibrio sp. JS02]